MQALPSLLSAGGSGSQSQTWIGEQLTLFVQSEMSSLPFSFKNKSTNERKLFKRKLLLGKKSLLTVTEILYFFQIKKSTLDLLNSIEFGRSNQSIRKEVNPEYSLEGLMLKLKLQHFCHLMWRVDSLEKTLILGKTEGRRRRQWQRTRWLDGITDSMLMSLSKVQETVKDREAWSVVVHGVTKNRRWLSDWTTTI